MSKLVQRRWESDYAGLTRRDRRPCDYEAYVPDPLTGRDILLEGDIAAEVSDAEAAIVRLNREAVALADTEALARLLLRAESVASSRIEGLAIGPRRLLRAEVSGQVGEESRDVSAAEVLGNIRAMQWAIDSGLASGKLGVEQLLEAHRRLLAGTRLSDRGGRVRTEQNWIGGSDYNPCSAAFVPPPPELVDNLLTDLVEWCNDDSLPPVVQAGLAHAQFETIHPFEDGNGRIGRVLIHLVLRTRGLAPRVLPPISLVLATWSERYVDGLVATRYVGPADSPEAHRGLNQWIAFFAAACRRAVGDAETFEQRVAELRAEWRARLGGVRAESAVDLLIRKLPAVPILTVAGAAELIGRTFEATNNAMSRLVEAGILIQSSLGKRNRAFEAPEVIDAFADLERRLASRHGDTRLAGPARPLPRRRR